MSYTHIKPGEAIELSAHVYSSHGQEGKRIAELVKLSISELGEMRQASEEAEKAIFAKIDAIASEWQKQAKETILLREALEYRRVSVPTHTYNRWTVDQYGRHEMSNMVYAFSWRLYERTVYRKEHQKSETVAWELSWSVRFNTPQNPDNTRTGRQIAGQDKKVFGTREEMDKYLQGRVKAYSHLFTETSPPIPKGEEGRFSVNGVLLPGYTVEVPELTPKEAADELLALLGDDDIPLAQPPEPKAPPAQPTPKKAPAHKPKKHTPTR